MSLFLLIVCMLDNVFYLLFVMVNCYGFIIGVIGIGKIVILQKLVELFLEIGVLVFMVDVKGDLIGIVVVGQSLEKLQVWLEKIGVSDWELYVNLVVFWDIFGEKGYLVWVMVFDFGFLLLVCLFNFNEVQSGVLNIIFCIVDDCGLLLFDFKDFCVIIQFIGDNVKFFQNQYGNINSVLIGVIQCGLLILE